MVVGTLLIDGLVVDTVFEGLVVALTKKVSAEFVVAEWPQLVLVPVIKGFIAFAVFRGFRKFQVFVRLIPLIVLLEIQRVTVWIVLSHDAGVLDELVLTFSEAFEFA